MTDSEERTPRCMFSGKSEDFAIWETKYRARGAIKGFAQILNGRKKLRTMPDIIAEADAAKIKEDEEISVLNLKAISDMLLNIDTKSTEGKRAFQTVKNSIDANDYPDGNAKKSWDALKVLYEPKTTKAYTKMLTDYHSRKLGTNEDPSDWITELGDMRDRLADMKKPIADDDFFVHIIGNMPLKYRAESKDFQKEKDANTLTLEYIKEELDEAYKALKGDEDSDDNKEDVDIALFGAGFKGNCNNCGKYGHKKATCPELKGNSQGEQQYKGGGNGQRKFKGKCFHCGKIGHKKHECRSNPDNRNKDNDGNNSVNEVADIVLMATDVPQETVPKKNYWFDWCQECEESDDEEDVIVQTIVGDDEDTDYMKINFLRDDFFDKFEWTSERGEHDSMNSETFEKCEEPWSRDYALTCIENTRPEPETEQTNANEQNDNRNVTVTNNEIIELSDEHEGNETDDDEPPPLIIRGYTEANWAVDTDCEDDESEDDDESIDRDCTDDESEDDESDDDDELIDRDCTDDESEDDESDSDDASEDDEPPPLIPRIVDYDSDDSEDSGDDEPPGSEYQTVEFDSDDSDDEAVPAWFGEDQTSAINSTMHEFALANMSKWDIMEMKLTNRTWFGDSAASTHMCNDDTHMYECTNIKEEIRVGSGKTILATKLGKLKVKIKQTNGTELALTLTGVKFVPSLWCNLFSLTAALGKGFDLGNQGRIITLSQGKDVTIGFDRIFPTASGFIMAAEMEQVAHDGANTVLEAGREIDILKFHELFGHPGEGILRNTASAYALKLKSKLDKCENCALAKSRQANTSKHPVERSKIKGERLMIDISSVKSKSAGGNKFWLMALDDATDFVWSSFIKQKSETSDKMIALIRDLKAKGYDVKTIRCDRAGENTKFQENAIKEGLGLTFEYTAPNTPQWNGRIERKFATLYGKTRAMMNSARITIAMRGNLWAHAAETATKLENALVYKSGSKSAHEEFWKEEPKYARYLKTFGEMAVIKVNTKIKGKLKDRGRTVMFVGYASDSQPDTYKFYDPKTRAVSRSRDVTWINKSYGTWKGIKQTNVQRLVQAIIMEDDDDVPDHVMSIEMTTAAETEKEPAHDIEAAPEPAPTTLPTRERRNLSTWQPPDIGLRRTRHQSRMATANSESGREDATRVRFDGETEQADEGTEIMDFEDNDEEPLFPDHTDVANMMFRNLQWPDLAMHASEEMMEEIKDENNENMKEPKTFQEAWFHPDEETRKKWRDAIRKEFHDMKRREVWRLMKRKDLPHGRKCTKCKWIFKIKRNGVYRARLVVCGYSQIPGVDFSEHFAPVIHDITWRILLVAMIIWQLNAWLIDVETAFLHGEFEDGETVFMDMPIGLEHIDATANPTEDCVELLKTAYGTVQGARQWWKKLVKILREIGFEGGEADPCLLHWKSEFGIIFIGLYVDDCLCIGKTKALELLENKLKEKGLTLKTDKVLKDYLSCDVCFNEDKTKAILTQPHLLKTLEEDFGEMVQKLTKYKTPGTPGQGLVRSDKGVTVTPEEQKLFRSGTGKLLYLVKHSRPDIANAVRELSKVLDATSPRAMDEMFRVIKHVLDTKGLGLRIEPVIGSNGLLWRIVAFSDSDFAGDPDSRISVSGYVIYLCGVPICWRSRAQKTVTLSSAEAEWIALSEVAKEVLFVAQILKSMGVKIEFPIVIHVDNTAAIFMANNITTNQRTRHVDIRTKFVTQYTGPDGILKIVFVKGVDNDSDIMTKNVTGKLHEKHVPKMMMDGNKTTK